MDLEAVKDAPAPELARGAVAAARNAHGLVDDAELLSGAGRLARAYSLAGLAVEEVGKAGSLAVLAAAPENLKARAPVGRLLAWHQLKLVKGMVIASVPRGVPAVGADLVVTPLSEIAEMLDDAQAFAEDMDRLKQRGLYVDVDRRGRIREPSEVTVAEVGEQLDRAQQAASAADSLLDPGAAAKLACPAAVEVEFSRAVVSAIGEMGVARSPRGRRGRAPQHRHQASGLAPSRPWDIVGALLRMEQQQGAHDAGPLPGPGTSWAHCCAWNSSRTPTMLAALPALGHGGRLAAHGTAVRNSSRAPAMRPMGYGTSVRSVCWGGSQNLVAVQSMCLSGALNLTAIMAAVRRAERTWR